MIEAGAAMEKKLAVVYVNLPEEETPVIRPTMAEVLGNNLFRLLPTERYDPEDEVWEFLPGTIVLCERRRTMEGEWVMRAVKQMGL
jgi:hypothetical protein